MEIRMYERITDFIEQFEAMSDFGERHDCTFMYNDTVNAFIKTMDDGFMVYDYPEVLKKIKERAGTHEIYDVPISALSADEALACITGAIRADRFCEGALSVALEDGFITRCLKRLRDFDVGHHEIT